MRWGNRVENSAGDNSEKCAYPGHELDNNRKENWVDCEDTVKRIFLEGGTHPWYMDTDATVVQGASQTHHNHVPNQGKEK